MTKKKLGDGCTDFTDFYEIFTDFGGFVEIQYAISRKKSVKIS